MGTHLPVFFKKPQIVIRASGLTLFGIERDGHRAVQVGLTEGHLFNATGLQRALGFRLIGIAIVLNLEVILYIGLQGTNLYPILASAPPLGLPQSAVATLDTHLGTHILEGVKEVFILARDVQGQGLAQLENHRTVRDDIAFHHQAFGRHIGDIRLELFHTAHHHRDGKCHEHSYDYSHFLHRYQNLMLYVTKGIGAPKMDIL